MSNGIGPTSTPAPASAELLRMRMHGPAAAPTLVYLPGIHGDWTLVSSFRAAVAGRVRFIEFTYPRTLAWSLETYADAILDELEAQGIERGVILAESFGSQIAWPLLERPARRFAADAIVLAGGFVHYPAPWRVRVADRFLRRTPLPWLARALVLYANYARVRHRHAPETLAAIGEFIARRTEPDRQAVLWRLRLILQADSAPIARRTRVPVFALRGRFDPVVPGWHVRSWLASHCPGYRGARVLPWADHNVLGTAPRESACQVWDWMQQAAAAGAAAGAGARPDACAT